MRPSFPGAISPAYTRRNGDTQLAALHDADTAGLREQGAEDPVGQFAGILCIELCVTEIIPYNRRAMRQASFAKGR
jgi:hypothetical protein